MSDVDTRRDTVLVVDDSPETLSFLTDALDQAGLTVLVAVDGASALTLLHQITPDLVLMDAIMPGMDGFDCCRRLKRFKHLAPVPVIFMTGLSETEHVVKGLEAGGVDYVTKPIVAEELLARMRVHLANARLTLSARAALDATGRFLLAMDRMGRLRWATPQAASLLAAAFDGFDAEDFALAPDLAERTHLAQGERLALTGGKRPLELTYLSRTGPDEILLRLTEAAEGGEAAILKQELALTQREAEVLAWLARGKPNRDISEILGISPRTVNKHLEQIFAKLGVENRASATALAVRALDQRQG
ncbi:DNA-binding response regulator [Aliidongia dinghuensis]|uniref:DNA-binding response regulator n=1 Tax=Aliidongia dinghuensis TaxID=1867774 RepID=A0A8J2YYI8_9PROT|nr:DNA-binding response regulator [Aliidongia dinghuensis]GGF41213.1 DNA-binding response regulator [Aliidongia dinghuensis]